MWQRTSSTIACYAGVFMGRWQELLVYVLIVTAAIFDVATKEDWEE